MRGVQNPPAIAWYLRENGLWVGYYGIPGNVMQVATIKQEDHRDPYAGSPDTPRCNWRATRGFQIDGIVVEWCRTIQDAKKWVQDHVDRKLQQVREDRAWFRFIIKE